jgi:hypothetical protein
MKGIDPPKTACPVQFLQIKDYGLSHTITLKILLPNTIIKKLKQKKIQTLLCFHIHASKKLPETPPSRKSSSDDRVENPSAMHLVLFFIYSHISNFNLDRKFKCHSPFTYTPPRSYQRLRRAESLLATPMVLYHVILK